MSSGKGGTFGSESVADRFLREGRRRRAILQDISRPFAGLDHSTLGRIGREQALAARGLDIATGGPTARAMRELAKQNGLFADTIRSFLTPQYFRAMQDTMSAIGQSFPELAKQSQRYDVLLGSAFQGVAQAVEAQSRGLRAIFGDPGLQDWIASVQSIAAAMQPAMTALARSAEIQLTTEMMTLRAAEGDDEAELSARGVSEQVVTANEALARLASSETPADNISAFTALMAALARLFERLQRNSKKEFAEGGLIFWFAFILLLADALDRLTPPELSSHDQAEIQQVQSSVQELRDQLTQFAKVVRTADAKFIETLPRAEVHYHANVRFEPIQSSPRIHRLTPGEIVAVADRKGRWRQVVFRDSLSNRLSMGWVYYSSLRPL